MQPLKIMRSAIKELFRIFTRFSNASPDNSNKRIPFEYIAEKLLEVIHLSRDVIGKKIILPDTYCLNFSSEDRAYRVKFENIIIEELKAIVVKELKKWNGVLPDQQINIIIDTDKELGEGSFYVDCIYSEKTEHSFITTGKQSGFKFEKIRLNTLIPSSDLPEMQSGSFVRTLINRNSEDENNDNGNIICHLKVSDKKGIRDFYLQVGKYSLGRSDSADIKLDSDDVRISRKHLMLKIEKEGLTIKMTGKNGGRINNEKIECGAECFANPGDTIIVSGTSITMNAKKVQKYDFD